MAKPQTAQNISSSASRAESAIAALKLRVVPSAPPATAVTIPTRAPPTAAARNTAGKYGVKNTSGRIWAIPQRAIVDKARQPAAKPVLKSSEGWEIPCQPRRNSSINFFIGNVTSRDQRIQNMAEHIENRGFAGRPWQYCGSAPADVMEPTRLPCRPRGRIIDGTGGRLLCFDRKRRPDEKGRDANVRNV